MRVEITLHDKKYYGDPAGSDQLSGTSGLQNSSLQNDYKQVIFGIFCDIFLDLKTLQTQGTVPQRTSLPGTRFGPFFAEYTEVLLSVL